MYSPSFVAREQKNFHLSLAKIIKIYNQISNNHKSKLHDTNSEVLGVYKTLENVLIQVLAGLTRNLKKLKALMNLSIIFTLQAL